MKLSDTRSSSELKITSLPMRQRRIGRPILQNDNSLCFVPIIGYCVLRRMAVFGIPALRNMENSVMAKRFNITGLCLPDRHYMVDISERVAQIKRMVDDSAYFCINRGRQYGKTTTLNVLKTALARDYEVYSISFEALDSASYETDRHLAYAMMRQFQMAASKKRNNISEQVNQIVSHAVNEYKSEKMIDLDDFSTFLTQMCEMAKNPLVLIIDEVDQASNYESFIRLLGLLRAKYLEREDVPTFQSVILAGVYDIKNLKLKMRPESDHQYNSPWNIATNFDVDMSFNVADVEGMLREYENDHHTGMAIHELSQWIIDYTSGYPFLVSKLCKTIDEKNLGWNYAGILEAVKQLLVERNTLFDDMNKKLSDFPELRNMLKNILYNGESYRYNADDKSTELAKMFNFITNDHGMVRISNRIFETRLYNAFAFEEENKSQIVQESYIDKNQFIENGQLNVEKIIQRFIVHFQDIYGDRDEKFVESEGRKYFMFYIKPIINGVGNYYIEAQTRDNLRTDMIIDYMGHQYIIEMKIWRGDSYNKRGEQQLLDYLDYYHLDKGYLMSFCFNKNKQPGVHTVHIGDREIVEGIV